MCTVIVRRPVIWLYADSSNDKNTRTPRPLLRFEQSTLVVTTVISATIGADLLLVTKPTSGAGWLLAATTGVIILLTVANHWRTGAILVLLSMPVVAVVLTTLAGLANIPTAIALAPMLALFVHASVDSHNHRRREFDRRRISLRMSAIEAFTKQRRESGEPGDRKTAEELMDEFVRKHFIEPDLDSNDMSYVGPRVSLVTVFSRNNKAPDKKAKPQ